MYEVFISSLNPIKTVAKNVPIPTPGPEELCIKVIATSSNPKDWQFPHLFPSRRGNEGDDVAGIVHSVGSQVHEFHPGDRVAGFHRMGAPNGSYAEYSITPSVSTFHLPSNISFDAGATIPLTAMTAAIALFQHLMLPLPWQTLHASLPKYGPLLVYGAGSTVGAWALKLAKLVKANKSLGVGPIIAVAGTSSLDLVRSLDAADYVVDYKKSDVVAEVKEILKREGVLLRHAFDAISHSDVRTWESVAPCLAAEGPVWLNLTDPPEEPVNWPANVIVSRVFVSGAYGEYDPDGFRSHEDAARDGEFSYCMYRYLARQLKKGTITTHPFEVMERGLDSVAEGLQLLYEGKVHGKKLVYRIADTPELLNYAEQTLVV
ncbi:GroES-like protein [Hyaloscypha variabilis F]|uniref:GroES-like protein n=1 Tax=Hyaloscypha variabilis (strain UAMH 11265 / GT02V1 / F) TaxID=1149755 RepID=A0A2J6R5P4_HYAVF|nr:GroES-like protein [Hyaloscypha variabilis F]